MTDGRTAWRGPAETGKGCRPAAGYGYGNAGRSAAAAKTEKTVRTSETDRLSK